MAKYKPTTREELKALVDDLSINLGDIDTSLITDMSFLFFRSRRVNEEFVGIESWNVSNVENMYGMFAEAKSFNQPLNSWNVSRVKNMACMFKDATSFNQPLDKWDVSNVKDMYGMFDRATSFNQPLDRWNVSNVENMVAMFAYATSFNQPLNSWNVSNSVDMRSMFIGAIQMQKEYKPKETKIFDKGLFIQNIINNNLFNEVVGDFDFDKYSEEIQTIQKGWTHELPRIIADGVNLQFQNTRNIKSRIFDCTMLHSNYGLWKNRLNLFSFDVSDLRIANNSSGVSEFESLAQEFGFGVTIYGKTYIEELSFYVELNKDTLEWVFEEHNLKAYIPHYWLDEDFSDVSFESRFETMLVSLGKMLNDIMCRKAYKVFVSGKSEKRGLNYPITKGLRMLDVSYAEWVKIWNEIISKKGVIERLNFSKSVKNRFIKKAKKAKGMYFDCCDNLFYSLVDLESSFDKITNSDNLLVLDLESVQEILEREMKDVR